MRKGRLRSQIPARSYCVDLVATVVIAAAFCIAFCWFWFGPAVSAPVRPQPLWEPGRLLSSIYDPPANAIEWALVKGDGQVFAGMATDPLVRHPEMVRGGPSEQAYRYQRPAYGWIGWLASGGQRGAVAWALVVVTAASVVLLVYAVGKYLLRRGADPRWALAVLPMPGVFADLAWVGPEALGVALLTFGLIRWLTAPSPARPGGSGELASSSGRINPDWAAVTCFAAAGLCRETMLLVPFVLAVAAAARGRFRLAFGTVLAAALYVAWVLFLRVRIGSWPLGSVGVRISLVPLGGLVLAVIGWGLSDILFAAFILGLAFLALVKGRSSGLQALIAVHLGFAAMLGEHVWHRFPDFGRVLLPLSTLSLLAVAPALSRYKGRDAPQV